MASRPASRLFACRLRPQRLCASPIDEVSDSSAYLYLASDKQMPSRLKHFELGTPNRSGCEFGRQERAQMRAISMDASKVSLGLTRHLSPR